MAVASSVIEQVEVPVRDKKASEARSNALLRETYDLVKDLMTPNGAIYWTPGTGAHEVHGEVWNKYAASGWDWSVGLPITDTVATPDGRGVYCQFERGGIFWSAETGAVMLTGEIGQKYAAMGGPASVLGSPIRMDVSASGAWYAIFQNGAIYWMFQSPNLGAYPFTPPPGWGLSLPVIYALWVLVVVMLYPVCRWFASVKARRRDPWLSYL